MHLVTAYRGSFAWTLVPAAVALVMFLGLCRSE